MKTIRSRKDIESFLTNFNQFADFDATGMKHYFIFDDLDREGLWTLMKYKDDSFSIHGKGKTYCDEEECFLSHEELTKLLWNNRKAVNAVLRELDEEKTLF